MDIFPATKDPVPPPSPSLMERRLSVALLALLIVIATGILLLQSHYDAARWRAQPTRPADNGATAMPAEEMSQVAGLVPMSPPETYDAANLSDKIDGKAELYLSAGFKSLNCRRFSLSGNPAQWMERFVYDMGDYHNAFAVFSRQRRDQARPLDLTPDAYRSANGLFLVQGPYYLEIVGSEGNDPLVEKMTELARVFVEAHPAAKAQPDERAFFPMENRTADAVSLTPVNAFGFDRLDHVYSAQYQWRDQTATAFISRRASADEARSLAAAYVEFLINYGGQRIQAPAGAPPVAIIEILDTYDIVFNTGDLLAGVHEAGDLQKGLALATQLLRKLNEAGHGR